MRPTQTLKLPQSGLTAHFITYWSWSEKQEVAKILLEGTTVDPQNGAVSDVLATNGLELNRKALQLAVKKLVNDEGVETPVSELFDLPEGDVDLILNKLKEIDAEVKKK
jgi:hypothetical protein